MKHGNMQLWKRPDTVSDRLAMFGFRLVFIVLPFFCPAELILTGAGPEKDEEPSGDKSSA